MLTQTIKPSKFCSEHPDKIVFARGLCKNCYNKWLIQNNPDYLLKQRENCKNWSKINKARKKQHGKTWIAKKDKEYSFIKNLRSYGMTIDDYNTLLKNQNGVCAICNKPPKVNKRLHVDHDHNTGLIRGLLCFRCNFGLSYFNENPDAMNRAYAYLIKEHHKFEIQDVQEQQFINCNTRAIPEECKKEMKNLRKQGMTISQLQLQFPKYSRSSIARASCIGDDDDKSTDRRSSQEVQNSASPSTR